VAIERLSAYLERRSGQVLDEPATAAALAGFVLRGLDCGAVDAAEVVAAGGPDPAELRRLARRAPSVFAPDALSPEALRAALLGVCASRRWADLVAAAAPYHSLAGLQRAADVALGALDESDLDEALAGHPRVGERADDPASRREQAGVDDTTRGPLLAANREYEARFGHVYLVRASGRTGEELLALLQQRLANDPAQERAVTRAELGRINALRLERLATEEAR